MDKVHTNMNVAILLCGGIGTRVGGNTPKQYLIVAGKPIVSYSLRVLQSDKNIHYIVIVAASSWHSFLTHIIQNEKISKFIGFSLPGSSRQLSVYSGLQFIAQTKPDTTLVLIHDAARPNLSNDLIGKCFKAIDGFDGVLPALPVKDTVYISHNGTTVNALLKRSEVFAGQAPELFVFKKYIAVHLSSNLYELERINGSTEIALKHGLKIKLIAGDEANYKITTPVDLERFHKEKQ